MKKTILTITIISLGLIQVTFASLSNDCNILTDKKNTIPIDKMIEGMVNGYGAKWYADVLPAEAFKKALTNLKAYCCTQSFKKYCSADDINNKTTYYPKSAILFDHLLDVAIRRLDGITWLAYNLSPDPTGLERRTKITEIANSATGMVAKKIENLYTGYREWHIRTTMNTGTVIAGYKTNNIATLSLGDKYNTICQIVKEIYNTYASSAIIWSDIEANSFLNGCKRLVKERIERENGYVKILMVQKSNQLLDEGTKAYTKTYFVQEKLMALWNLIAKVKDVFETIIQQSPASKTCST